MNNLDKKEELNCDKVRSHNSLANANHQPNNHQNNLNCSINHPKKDTKMPTRKISNRNAGLTLDERRAINIDSVCHLNWMIIIIIFTLINLYNFGYIESKCRKYKETLILFSRLISSISAIETTAFYLIWFFLTNSKYYYLQIIYDSITGTHIFFAFLNILYAVTTFLSRTCHENKLTENMDFSENADKIHLLALKYDLKLAGALHIFLTIIISFSAIHLTTKRSKYLFHFLSKRGLLTEYFWETLD